MKPYTLSIPIINDSITPQNRQTFLHMLRSAQADRVVLTIHGVFACDIAALYENIAFFTAHGLDAALWVGHTVGHTGDEFSFAETSLPYQRVLRRDGSPFRNTFCPFDPEFQNSVGERLAEIVKDAALRLVLLDDDCTLSQKGFGCTCPRHLARMYQYLGETPDRDTLAKKVFTGKANRYRRAWMQAQADSIMEFADVLRAHVNRVRPDIALSICTAFSHWSFDGVDSHMLCRRLAGANPPVERLHGAPYWSSPQAQTHPKPLGFVCETARMFASFFRDANIELISEADVYPRPRTNCSASRLELFDAAMRADGSYDGILKYMINYNRCPEQETGYVDLHKHDLPAFQKIRAFFDGGANTGVNICAAPNLVRDADLGFAPELFFTDDLDSYPRCIESPQPYAGQLFSVCGIPTVYNAHGLCDAVFGENARHFDPAQLSRGLILDARAAQIYSSAGVDVGFGRVLQTAKERIFSVRGPDSPDGDPLAQDARCYSMITHLDLAPACTPVLLAKLPGREVPLAYTYENRNGVRFLVLTLDGFDLAWDASPLCGSYPMQRMLKKVLPWLARKPFPVVSPVVPNLYLLCRQTAQTLSVLACNISEDPILTPQFTVCDPYASVECITGSGRIENGTLLLTNPIPPFSFTAFRLTK